MSPRPHRTPPPIAPRGTRLQRSGLVASLHLLLVLLLLPALPSAALANGAHRPTVLLVVGAPGQDIYARDFSEAAGLWERACEQADAEFIVIGMDDPDPDNPDSHRPDIERLRNNLAAIPTESDAPLWIVLVGHGTFDGRHARFNLRGPDFTAEELAAWLEPYQRPIAVIQGASASAPFLQALSGPNRVIVTATRSGYEQNYARFGLHFARAIASPDADLDKDGQVSILEAFLVASRTVGDFYETEGRLATEHALLDDNGDGRGTPADWFEGLRVTRKSADGALPDGFRARQWHLVPSDLERILPPDVRQRRDQLELDVAHLRELKPSMDEEIYYQQLELLLLQIARLYDSAGLIPSHSSTP
jgi:hypothetical protein